MTSRCTGSPEPIPPTRRVRWVGTAVIVPLVVAAAATARAADAPVPVPEPTPEALRYYRGGCVLWVVNHLWDLAVPAALLASGLSASLRNLAQRLGRGWLGPTVAVYAALYLVLNALIDLPLGLYQGYFRQHAYGLSNQSLARWLDHRAKGLAVSIVITIPLAIVAFGLIRRSPKRWWLYLGLLSLPFTIFGALVQPVLVDPLFNDFGPMRDKALETRILELARRAGIEGGRVFQVDKSRDTNAVNAYVNGLLGSHRIVLWDTLLEKLDDDEVLFVMGHEMGHYVLNHVIQGIAVGSFLALLGLFLVDRLARAILSRWGGRLGIHSLADVAAAPLLLIGIELAALALVPLGYAFSRRIEHEADRFALELTRANRAGALSFVKMQRENLSIPRPTLLDRIWRMTHPSLAERIEFCNTYRPWDHGDPGHYAQRFLPE